MLDIQEELATLDPLLEVRDHLYRDNLNAAFAGLAAASTEGHSAARLVPLGKDLWWSYEEQGQTDMALATLDLLARSLTAADLPRDSLRVWYEEVDPERGRERFSQMTGDSGPPVLEPSGQEAELSGEYTDLTSGEPFDLSELDGRMVLFDFWATWCAPCIDDIPKLKELVTEYGDDFVLVTVSSDAVTGGADEEGVRDFMEKHGINYMVLFDTPENSLTERFGVEAYPSKFLIDETGTFLTPPRKEDSQTVRLEEVAAFMDSRQ